ncbi:hypothetical protein LguiB_004075 [Lonicera macranthoides]
MSESAFDGQILSDKLSKLNSSQQSIESLSRWCISHRKRAKQIVETWDKLFKSAQKEQRVSFLYLSNDILQNSRRKGSEFVNEFWKILPATLKNVYESGDENGKKAASRLVDIWEERKVFGSRGQNLKDELMGKNPLPPPLVSNGKSSNPIKIVKRDAHSLRIKLAVGGMPEKILTGFQLVHDENVNEEAALNKCKDAVTRVGDIERDVESISAQGNLQGSAAVVGEIQEQENVLQQCASQLESAEATRSALVSQLKEALQDQESKLELIRSQLQVVHGQIEQATNIRERLTSPSIPSPPITTFKPPVEPNLLPVQLNSLAPPAAQPMMTFSATKTTEEESKKAAAAAVAAKLAASTSSAQMLTSVLSSLVAEEAAASMSGGLKSGGFSSLFSPEKRQKLEKPMTPSDGHNSEAATNSPYYALQQQTMVNVSLAPPPPPPPPPPPVQASNSPVNQFVQSAGLMMGIMPYGYAASSLPPPPPMPSHISMGLARPALQPPQSPQQHHQQQQQQQQTGNGGYYRPPGIGFYGQSHQPTPPPVPRQ